MLDDAIRRTESGHELSIDETIETFDSVITGRCSEDEIARWLVALNRKGPSVSEVAGAALALRRKMTPIRSSRGDLLDTCGTGGDRLNTFNISTAAALVTAAAGVPVAKHGNRAATSRSGSADVLAVLGVNVEASVAVVERCLDELGICFCFAPLLHDAMRHVGPVRKKLGVPTIFNILGPLINPAGAPRQLLGVGRPELRVLLARALVLLGTERSVVVHGSDGLDEVTLCGSTEVAEAQCTLHAPRGEPQCTSHAPRGEPQCTPHAPRGESPRAERDDPDSVPHAEREEYYGELRQFRWTPADFCLNAIRLSDIQVSGPEESAAMIRAVLAGDAGPARDIVIANAAAALWTAGKATTPASCAAIAKEAIESGAAREILARLAAMTHEALRAD